MVEGGAPEIPLRRVFEGIGRFRKEKSPIEKDLNKLKKKNWKKELKEISFHGDLNRGAAFLHAASQGIVDAITALQKRGMIGKEYVVPDVKLVHAQPENYFQAQLKRLTEVSPEGSRTISHSIQIDLSYLEKGSFYDQHTFFVFKDNRDFVVAVGRQTDLAYLIGFEEAAHSVFLWNRKPFPHVDENSVGLAAYDAIPAEYHSLGWRIRGIMDRPDLSPETKEAILKPLKQRMQEAIAYRQSFKSKSPAT